MNTSWLNPNVAYEQAVTGFLRRIVQDNGSPFVADLDQFVRALADAGYVNGLAQTLIKICCPGVPDFYQGTEFWDFNLVDPDNRRRVDFLQRRHALASLLTPCDPPGLRAAELLAGWPDKRIKLFVLAQALRHRRERREFWSGDYVPLAAEGPRADRVVAFARVAGNSISLCLAPRLALPALAEFGLKAPAARDAWPAARWWQETQIESPAGVTGSWRHVFTGRRIRPVRSESGRLSLELADVFSDFPVALLASDAALLS